MARPYRPTIQKRGVVPIRRGNALRFAFTLLIAGGCALPNRGSLAPSVPPPDGPAARGPGEIAVASWYGREFHGRRTASGEIFDQHALSAAHPTLPLGSRVRVTSLATGESVDVRITDRGPFVKGRTLDLSYGAARRLRMLKQGTGRVRIEVLEGTRGPIVESRRMARDSHPHRDRRASSGRSSRASAGSWMRTASTTPSASAPCARNDQRTRSRKSGSGSFR